jgi:hypothetical protein
LSLLAWPQLNLQQALEITKEALRRFDTHPAGQRMALLVLDGLDVSHGFRSASPFQSIDLDRAISEAQRRGVAVYTFYAPSVRLTSVGQIAVDYGQGSLNRLADETGGEAFFTGTDFVPSIRTSESSTTFSPASCEVRL